MAADTRSRGEVTALAFACAMVSLLAGVWGGHRFVQLQTDACDGLCEVVRRLASSCADMLGLSREVGEDVSIELSIKAGAERLPKDARIHRLLSWHLLPPLHDQYELEHSGDVWDLLDSIPANAGDYYNSQRSMSDEYMWLLEDIGRVLQNTALIRPGAEKYAATLDVALRRLERGTAKRDTESVQRIDENSAFNRAVRNYFRIVGWDEERYKYNMQRYYAAYDAFRRPGSRVAVYENSGTVDRAEYLIRPDFAEWYSTAAAESIRVTSTAADGLQAFGAANTPEVSVTVGAARFGFFEVATGDWFDPGITDLAREVLPEERFEALLGPGGVMSRRLTTLAIAYEPSARFEVPPSTYRRLRQLTGTDAEAWKTVLAGAMFDGTEQRLDSAARWPSAFVGAPGRAYVVAVISMPTVTRENSTLRAGHK